VAFASMYGCPGLCWLAELFGLPALSGPHARALFVLAMVSSTLIPHHLVAGDLGRGAAHSRVRYLCYGPFRCAASGVLPWAVP